MGPLGAIWDGGGRDGAAAVVVMTGCSNCRESAAAFTGMTGCAGGHDGGATVVVTAGCTCGQDGGAVIGVTTGCAGSQDRSGVWIVAKDFDCGAGVSCGRVWIVAADFDCGAGVSFGAPYSESSLCTISGSFRILMSNSRSIMLPSSELLMMAVKAADAAAKTSGSARSAALVAGITNSDGSCSERGILDIEDTALECDCN